MVSEARNEERVRTGAIDSGVSEARNEERVRTGAIDSGVSEARNEERVRTGAIDSGVSEARNEERVSPAVLLVHGVASSFEHNWLQSGWVDLLADAGREVVAFDLPGHGKRRAEPAVDAAELIVAEAESRGQIDAVGFSAGGFAVLRAAVGRPELFNRIVVMGVADASLTRVAEAADGAGLGGMLAALRADDEPESGPALVIRRLAATAGNDPAAVAEFMAARHPNPALDDLAAITAQTLIVEGSEDFGGSAQEITAAIPRSDFSATDAATRVGPLGRSTEFLCRDLNVGLMLEQHRQGVRDQLGIDVSRLHHHQHSSPVESLGHRWLLLQVESAQRSNHLADLVGQVSGDAGNLS
jgi:pimeloyl-ACP methyl ester carboxylesterase